MARAITLEVEDATLAARRAKWVQPNPPYERGYGWMFAQHVAQADKGCDFDYLTTSFGARPKEPDIY